MSKPDQFNINLGRLLTTTRLRFGMSQKDVAQRVGLTFQQIQKYESAGNRIAASTLAKIAECFEMTPGQLLDGANQPYMHDPDIIAIINAAYKTNRQGRKLMHDVALAIATCYPE